MESEEANAEFDWASSVEIEEDLHFIGFDASVKGVVGSASQPGHACDILHLDTILHNLGMILYFCKFDVEEYGKRFKVNLDDYRTTLTDTTAEIARLMQHPSLFPGSAVRDAFGSSLAKMYQKIKRTTEVYENMEDEAEEFLVDQAEARERDLLPLRQPNRTHWQNFLHKDAPGVSHGPNYPFAWDPPGVGATQMLPIPAANFLTARIKESIDILNELDDHNGVAKLSHYDRHQQLKPKGSIHDTISRDIAGYQDPQAPIVTGELGGVVRGRRTQTLEVLSDDFAFLSQNLTGPRPQANDRSLVVKDRP